jgi:ABC-2 type transport system permease protein
MTRILILKLLRDIRLALIIVAVLLAAFQTLWARVTKTITSELLKLLGERLPGGAAALDEFFDSLLKAGPAQIVQTLMGGETIDIKRIMDMLSIGYVHPLTQTILCIWAIGRASGAIAGEIDRGTMELLLAQPIARSRIVLAHFLVDLIAIPILCLSMWGGTWLGTWLVGLQADADPWRFAPALLNVAALLLAVGGFSMAFSAFGRFRGRVLGVTVLITLLQFLINVIGQLWPVAEPLRPFTVFYYYQPQPIILDPHWYRSSAVWMRLSVLLGVGFAGYAVAWWHFCRRDLPAPL